MAHDHGTDPLDQKQVLHHYLRLQRQALESKLDGLDEYDLRRPMTPTATNLLGLVKHVASVQLEYFGSVFDRKSPREPLPWYADDDTDPDGDMYVRPGETTAEILDLWNHSAENSDATIDALDLDSIGNVPWWGDRSRVTLQQILVHMGTETARHAGHADIIRELIDGAAGLLPNATNLPGDRDAAGWAAYRAKVEELAVAAGGRSAG